MPDTFESLLVKLSRARVDYLVAGGVAVCLNGFVRTTNDLDILVDGSPANISLLLHCLAGFGEGFARELSVGDFGLEEGAVRIVEEFTIDIFTVMRGRTFDHFAGRARVLTVGDLDIRFMAPESLIELKANSSREKDRLDVATLVSIMAGQTPSTTVDLNDITPPAD